MLLAVFLHPMYTIAGRKPLDKTLLSSVTSIIHIDSYYYRRFIGGECDGLMEGILAGSMDTFGIHVRHDIKIAIVKGMRTRLGSRRCEWMNGNPKVSSI
ncbi:Hypothetical protein PHPALM_117 [Phytophthora palmivora]|uniref:Uncharacterized protein n=1 Tax=Phytophthora palmivora TaxID=4796 RepID=A0A2P4YVN7_9STRA|nr:Hypothetical protein PHPALM_117 [Phytophthora palmivora]